MSEQDPAVAAERVITAALNDFTGGRHRGVVVDSPPGAGKSTLVVRASTAFAAADEPVMVVAQTNEQVDDLVYRMAQAAPNARIGRLSANDYEPDHRVLHPNVSVRTRLEDLDRPHITIATAAKWGHVRDARWQRAIVDEAYQMRSDMLLRVANRFEEALFVGDPGQLDPFSTIDEDVKRWTGLAWDPLQSAVAAMMRSNSTLPLHRLPVSWRLSHQAARPVQEAFYPTTGFDPATTRDQRRMTFRTRAVRAGAEDETLELAARAGWALHELPARHTVRTDSEAVQAIVGLALRLLERGAIAWSELAPGGREVTANRIAIGAAHRDQVAAVRRELAVRGNDQIRVDTANRLQGSEFDVVFVLHPLSGRKDATAFHLESGRFCVLTSRHRHACVVVARAGIQQLLDAHPPGEPLHVDVPAKFPDGWEANQSMLAHLSSHRVQVV